MAISGYLTFDPLRYTNILMSIVLPIVALLLGGFGLPGGAVYIDTAALRSKWWVSAVSAAGPIPTLLWGVVRPGPWGLGLGLQRVDSHELGLFGTLALRRFLQG